MPGVGVRGRVPVSVGVAKICGAVTRECEAAWTGRGGPPSARARSTLSRTPLIVWRLSLIVRLSGSGRRIARGRPRGRGDGRGARAGESCGLGLTGGEVDVRPVIGPVLVRYRP